MNKMINIKFRYKDAMSNWEWREQSCVVESLSQCRKIYGLDEGDVEWEVISIEEV